MTPAHPAGIGGDRVTPAIWNEAANRRLRALMWKRLPVGEIAFLLGRPLAVVKTQLRTLGLKP